MFASWTRKILGQKFEASNVSQKQEADVWLPHLFRYLGKIRGLKIFGASFTATTELHFWSRTPKQENPLGRCCAGKSFRRFRCYTVLFSRNLDSWKTGAVEFSLEAAVDFVCHWLEPHCISRDGRHVEPRQDTCDQGRGCSHPK